MTANWMGRALCAQIGGDLWFPEKGGNTTAAIAVCRACPVAAECLSFSMELTPGERSHGIWGGLTPRKRAKLVNGQRPCQHCGTYFPPANKWQRMCSDTCREASRQATLQRAKKTA